MSKVRRKSKKRSSKRSSKRRKSKRRSKSKTKDVLVENFTGSYIPKSKLTKKNKKYIIHDNMSRPFKVFANKNKIEIYRPSSYPENQKKLKYDKLIKRYTSFKGYWPGLDKDMEYTQYYDPKRENGNTILIKLTKQKYVYVGKIIYEFETGKSEEIIDYVSPIGNSDVPYPIAISNNYVYFMIEKMRVPINKFSNIDMYKSGKIYEKFYKKFHKKKVKSPNLKKIKIIQKRLFCFKKIYI